MNLDPLWTGVLKQEVVSDCEFYPVDTGKMNTLILLLIVFSFSSLCRGQNDTFPDAFHIIYERACTTYNSAKVRTSYVIALYDNNFTPVCDISRTVPYTYLFSPYNSSTLNCSQMEQTYTFCFSRITHREAGKYTMRIDNFINVTGTVFVMDQPTTPRINQPYQGVEGGRLSITCASNSNSRPRGQDLTYVWLLNGSSVLPSRFQSSASILTISNLRRTDNSYEIRCYVNETKGLVSNISSPYRAIIHYGPGDSINITWNGAYPLIENKSQSIPPLICSANCYPACIYRWTGPFIGGRSGNPLGLGKAFRNKTGSYNCTATNTILGAERTAYTHFYLSVSYPTSVVTIIPSDQELEINETVTQVLNCNADGYPYPSIKWYKDDKLLNNSNKYTISNADCLNSGNYTCRADNYYGGSNKSISLRARCSPRLYNDVSSIVIDVADFTQTLTVYMLGYPLPKIRWYYELDGNNHTAGGNKSTIENETDLLTSSLSVYIYEEYHFRDYFAVAAGTSIGKRFILKPNRRPNAPYHLQADCKSNGIANVSWTSAFNGGHQQIFTVLYGLSKDNTRLKTSERYADLGQGQIHYVMIPDLLQNQNYEFLVNAENIRGSSTSTTLMCTLRGLEDDGGDSGSPFAAGFGTAAGVVVIISIGVVLLILYRKGSLSRACKKEGTDRNDKNSTAYDGLVFEVGTENNSHTYQELSVNTGATKKVPSEIGNTKSLDGKQSVDHIYGNSNTEKKASGKARKGKGAPPVVYENTVLGKEEERKVTN